MTTASASTLHISSPAAYLRSAKNHPWERALVWACSQDPEERTDAILEAAWLLETIQGQQGLDDWISYADEADPTHIYCSQLIKAAKRQVNGRPASVAEAHLVVETLRVLASEVDVKGGGIRYRTNDPLGVDWDTIEVDARSEIPAARIRAIFASQTINESLLRILGRRKLRVPASNGRGSRDETLEQFITRVLRELGAEPPRRLGRAIEIRNALAHEVPEASDSDASLVVSVNRAVFQELFSAVQGGTSAESSRMYVYNGPSGPTILDAVEIAKQVRATPQYPHGVWREGWTDWRAPDGVAEIARLLDIEPCPASLPANAPSPPAMDPAPALATRSVVPTEHPSRNEVHVIPERTEKSEPDIPLCYLAVGLGLLMSAVFLYLFDAEASAGLVAFMNGVVLAVVPTPSQWPLFNYTGYNPLRLLLVILIGVFGLAAILVLLGLFYLGLFLAYLIREDYAAAGCVILGLVFLARGSYLASE